jgi:virulence factor Mce-like protein
MAVTHPTRPPRPPRRPVTSRRGLDTERLVLEAKRSSRSVLALLGLIALALVSVTIIFTNIGITLPWQSTYTREIALSNAKGIVAGEQSVRLAGVKVGRITSLKLENGRAVATISIDPRYAPLYHNAVLSLRPDTPLDDMYLDIISRGTPSTGRLGADQVLAAQRTQVPVDVSSVLDIFNADTRSRVKESIDNLGEALGPEGENFDQALADLAPFLGAAKALTAQTAIRQTETRQLVHNFELITATLANRNTQVRELVTNGASTLSELGGQEGSVQAVINQLPATMSQLTATFATLRATENHLDPALQSLEPVAAALPTALRDLTRFSTHAEPAFAKLQKPLPLLNDLMRSLSPTAVGLNRSLRALKQTPSQLNTITQLVEPCEPALADFFQNTISIGKFSSNLSVILRGETVVGTDSGAGLVNDLVKPTSCLPSGAS